MALESLRDPVARLSALPVTLNAAYDANNANSLLWSATRQYVQNDVVVVEVGGVTTSFVLAGASSLLGGLSPEDPLAVEWVALAGAKAYPPVSTFSVVARMPTVSVSAWSNAAKVGRK